MSKKYDTLVFICRAQPLHRAHEAIIEQALELTDSLVILIGSSDQPRTYKNPFSFVERRMMITNALSTMENNTTRVDIEPLVDYLYSDTKWATQVQGIVSKYAILGGKTGIIGHRKTDTKYLDMFPQWEIEDIGMIGDLHATNIREQYFTPQPDLSLIKGTISDAVLNLLKGWAGTPEYVQIVRERLFIDNYKKQFSVLPYPPIFVTVDAVVVCSGHVLMIKRKSEPGKGLWALPGGFLNANTDYSIENACIRELREETKIKVPDAVLRGSIKKTKVFDAVGRSARGRTITHAHLIELPDGELPKVRGSDDAEKAMWIPLAELKRNQCFEDHYEIVTCMLGL